MGTYSKARLDPKSDAPRTSFLGECFNPIARSEHITGCDNSCSVRFFRLSLHSPARPRKGPHFPSKSWAGIGQMQEADPRFTGVQSFKVFSIPLASKTVAKHPIPEFPTAFPG